MDGTITVALKSRPSMFSVAFNPGSRIETLLEGASVLFAVNSMLRLSPVFAYKGCVCEYNLMIWTPLSVGAVTSA